MQGRTLPRPLDAALSLPVSLTLSYCKFVPNAVRIRLMNDWAQLFHPLTAGWFAAWLGEGRESQTAEPQCGNMLAAISGPRCIRLPGTIDVRQKGLRPILADAVMSNTGNDHHSLTLKALLEAARRANWDALVGPQHLRTGRFNPLDAAREIQAKSAEHKATAPPGEAADTTEPEHQG